MEGSLGKNKLAQLYALLDEVIALEGPVIKHSGQPESSEQAFIQ